jgi:hypothetical protein
MNNVMNLLYCVYFANTKGLFLAYIKYFFFFFFFLAIVINL